MAQDPRVCIERVVDLGGQHRLQRLEPVLECERPTTLTAARRTLRTPAMDAVAV
ncbi:hypothetical protein [Actinomadura sp. 9N407]|uniref:hypothetical protein n=1 Tax=Actinomadura sp. 9N407 TaxID=3375154 RepID=UPI00378F6284